MVYVISYLLIVLVCFSGRDRTILLSSLKRTRLYPVPIVFAFVVLTTIAILRADSVGADTRGYMQIYNYFSQGASIQEVHNLRIYDTIEIGYLYICKILSIFQSRYVFLGVQYGFIYCTIIKYLTAQNASEEKSYFEQDNYFGLMVFIAILYTSTLNLLRQYLALSFLLISFFKLKNKQYKAMIIFFIVAVMIHKSSVLFIPVYIIYLLKNKKNKLIAFEVALIVLAFVIGETEIVNRILILLGYTRLLNGVHFVAPDSGGMMAYVYFSIVVLGTIIALIKKYRMDEDFYFYLMTGAIGTLFAWLSSENEMFSRVAVYFLLNIPILLERIINNLFSQSSRKVVYLTVSMIMIIAVIVSSRGYAYKFAFLQ